MDGSFGGPEGTCTDRPPTGSNALRLAWRLPGALGDGVYELRVDIGPGYRVYFAQPKRTLILLLHAGTKHSQRTDIEKAKTYWGDYQGRTP
jgi:putative component of toxin-antitoxin plasmid stabilization module